MKTLLLLIGPVSLAVAMEPTLPAISLVPEHEMGRRGVVAFKEIVWKADCEWFTKLVPVCRVSRQPFDLEPFRKLAEEYQIPVTPRWTDPIAGNREDGTVYYLDKRPGVSRWSIANPKTRAFSVGLARYFEFERDADQNPILKPLPGKEEAVAISRKWMKKLGIDENLLYRHGSGPEGFDVVFRIDLERGWNEKLKRDVEYDYGITLNFAQQIGGLRAFWTATGGSLSCAIGDGGEFCFMKGKLSAWEKIGDYPVLDRAELEQALREGFAWTDEPLACETLTVQKIRLEAYHFREDAPKKDFPLIYVLECGIQGGANDGEVVAVALPALRQQRDRYGPLPAQPPRPGEEEKPVVPRPPHLPTKG